MNNDIRNKAILKTAGTAVFAMMFCIGCYDLGIEPSVKAPIITTFVDIRDGKTYKKEQIGDQIWMAENLNFAADGSVCYDSSDRNCEIYGRLYDWNTAMGGESGSNSVPSGVEGVCPVGWHLPSNAEWKALIYYVGINAGTKLKSNRFRGQSELQRPDGTDIYNFSALPSGVGMHYDNKTDFYNMGAVGSWWSATELESDADMAWVLSLIHDDTGARRFWQDKHIMMLSVRCVHD